MSPSQTVRPHASTQPIEDGADPNAPRRKRLNYELASRALVSLIILAYNDLFGLQQPLIRFAALFALLLNGPYYFAANTGRWLRLQAYGRMLIDIVLLTLWLYVAGGLAAASYVGIYAIVPVYAGTVFSSRASLVATGFATASYLTVALLQHTGQLPAAEAPVFNAWAVAAFNLLFLNIVGALAALLGGALRQSRRQMAALYEDLARAHDQLFRLTIEIQRASRLQLLGEVMAGVTHEIRNALQVAFGHIGFLRRKIEALRPDAAQDLDRIESGCNAALRIIKGALEMGRRQSTRKVPVSLSEVARGVVDLKAHDLRRQGIFVHIEFPTDFPRVLAVPFQLQQVLLNLVMNAQDALREAAGARVIEIVGLSRYKEAVVEVRDTGPGIPSEALPRLFEPFYTTKEAGTGLGLVISAGIVRELGGELTAANRLNGGAVFRLSLPAVRSVLAEAR